MKESESKPGRTYKNLSVKPDTFREINILKAKEGYTSYNQLINEELLED